VLLARSGAETFFGAKRVVDGLHAFFRSCASTFYSRISPFPRIFFLNMSPRSSSEPKLNTFQEEIRKTRSDGKKDTPSIPSNPRRMQVKPDAEVRDRNKKKGEGARRATTTASSRGCAK
jgi:hypothetical protein